MASSSKQTIFVLGATGFIGSRFLHDLGKDSELCEKFHVAALLRDPTSERVNQLKALFPDLEVVEGTLDSDEIIREQAQKADVVFNIANSIHAGAIKATLEGLETNSASHPGKPPLYIHIAGLGALADNTHGEFVEDEKIKKHNDIGFKLDDVPEANPHVALNKVIVAAGTRKEKPVRTIILYPGWVYGFTGVNNRVTAAVQLFTSWVIQAGYAGTWGPGHSKMSKIHVKDVANAIMIVFKAALEGKADEGADGLYFVADDSSTIHESREVMARIGDVMFEKGIAKQPGSQPFPTDHEIVQAFGDFGWRMFGSNTLCTADRLRKFNWEPVETRRTPFMNSLTEELETFIRTSGY